LTAKKKSPADAGLSGLSLSFYFTEKREISCQLFTDFLPMK
jgi:hypothetical protein